MIYLKEQNVDTFYFYCTFIPVAKEGIMRGAAVLNARIMVSNYMIPKGLSINGNIKYKLESMCKVLQLAGNE